MADARRRRQRGKELAARHGALIVASALALLGFVDAVLLLDYADSWVPLLQDPGKFVFHIVLLPCAAYLFLRRYPNPLRERLRRRAPRAFAIGLTLILFVYGVRDCWLGFESEGRLPWPTDFADRDLGRELLAKTYELNADIAMSTNAPVEDRKNYLAAIPRELGARQRSFWEHGSLRAQWAAVLSGLGSAMGGFIFVSVAVFVLGSRKSGTAVREVDDELRRDIGTLAVALSLLLAWLPFRVYSEWYSNFGSFDAKVYQPVGVVAFAAIACAVLLFFRWDFRHRKATVGVFAAVAAVVGVATEVQFSWMAAVAGWFYVADWFTKSIVYVIVATLCVAVTAMAAAPGEENAG